MLRLIVWKKPNNIYYYRVVKTHYTDYFVGYKNSYNHEIVLIITNLDYKIKKTPFKKRLKRRIINYIEKI